MDSTPSTIAKSIGRAATRSDTILGTRYPKSRGELGSSSWGTPLGGVLAPLWHTGPRSCCGSSLPLGPQSPPYSEHGVMPKLFFSDMVTPAIQWFFSFESETKVSQSTN